MKINLEEETYMKIEWRKQDKKLYLPKDIPTKIDVPSYTYITLEGHGNPNGDDFKEKLQALYAFSYGIRMSYKWANPPTEYYNYTVYPLEGIWDIHDKSIYKEGVMDKDNLSYKIMIRQPDFINPSLFEECIEKISSKVDKILLNQLKMERIEDGHCLQILHTGCYDDEHYSFEKMDDYCLNNSLERIGNTHKEIYLSDPRKTAPSKLKTVLRYWVKDQ